FDAEGGLAPKNWNSYFGGDTSTELTNLISESGTSVPYTLSISSSGAPIETFASNSPIDSADLPIRALPLDNLDGYIGVQNDTLTFTWNNLEPWSYHQIYVFGHADFDAGNFVTITGGN